MKTVSMDSIYLKGGSYYVTQNEHDVFRVIKGRIYIYIVPVVEGEIGRRTLLCEVGEKELIPAFSYTDMDYQMWEFCFVAQEEAILECLQGVSTKPLKKRFCLEHAIHGFENEEFEDSLVDFYRKKLVREDAFLIRTNKDKQETKRNISSLIMSLFSKGNYYERREGDQSLYRMVSVLCKKMKIEIAPYETVKQCAANEMSVMEIASISHFPCREVVLEENWYNFDAGGLVVFVGKGKKPAICIPKGKHGYVIYIEGEKPVKLTKKIAEQCEPKAYMIYWRLPDGEVTQKDFLKFCFNGLNKRDVFSLIYLTVISSVIGLLIPFLNEKLYDEYIPMGQEYMILQIGAMILLFMTGNIIFSIISSICKYRISSRIQYQVQNAVYYRVFQLPESFFRKYESADLAKRVSVAGMVSDNYIRFFITITIGGITAAFYLCRMFTYSISLTFVSLGIIIITSAIIYGIATWEISHEKDIMNLDSKCASVLFQFIQGIEKIRIAGIEDRVVYEYMKLYVEQRKKETKLGRSNGIKFIIIKSEPYVITLLVYVITYNVLNISMGMFVAFSSALGYLTGVVRDLINAIIDLKKIKPYYARMDDVLKTNPERVSEKTVPIELRGNIDINHISFSYSDKDSAVFNDLSIQIKEGEYVGIVGSSGCGKSTLLKLLLGFETPTSGKIYYDNQDMSDINLQELRKRFGVVLQDGELIAGSIFENITLTAPWAGNKEVNAIVEAVGLTDDIANMPMGLQTIVSENCNTISGGQKQRILIARAIINNPKVIFFDEATSALDNITQSKVSGTLDDMNVTRIVIAHRLSTIKNCNRILVFDKGSIVEDGNYDELLEKKGVFYKLARRQMLDF